VHVQRLDPDLELPSTAHVHDAGFDLRARIDVVLPAAGSRAAVPTGIAIALPVGTLGMVVPRSGLALKHGISLVNTPGIIDAGYRGELQVVMINHDPHTDYAVKRGDRVAQLVVLRHDVIEWIPVDELSGDDRGGGFGHSGR
jgi:dUTP pyrophosphatase